MKRLSIIIIVISLLALLAIGCGGSSPSGTLISFLKAVDDGDYSKATSYLTSSALEGFTPSYFYEGVELFEERAGIKQIKIIKEEISGEVAQIDFEIEFKNGDSDQSTAYLIKDNGKWKIPEF